MCTHCHDQIESCDSFWEYLQSSRDPCLSADEWTDERPPVVGPLSQVRVQSEVINKDIVQTFIKQYEENQQHINAT